VMRVRRYLPPIRIPCVGISTTRWLARTTNSYNLVSSSVPAGASCGPLTSS
jgi:hypothetical protein